MYFLWFLRDFLEVSLIIFYLVHLFIDFKLVNHRFDFLGIHHFFIDWDVILSIGISTVILIIIGLRIFWKKLNLNFLTLWISLCLLKCFLILHQIHFGRIFMNWFWSLEFFYLLIDERLMNFRLLNRRGFMSLLNRAVLHLEILNFVLKLFIIGGYRVIGKIVWREAIFSGWYPFDLLTNVRQLKDLHFTLIDLLCKKIYFVWMVNLRFQS